MPTSKENFGHCMFIFAFFVYFCILFLFLSNKNNFCIIFLFLSNKNNFQTNLLDS